MEHPENGNHKIERSIFLIGRENKPAQGVVDLQSMGRRRAGMTTAVRRKLNREWLGGREARRSAKIASLEVSTMFTVLECLKYLAVVVVALSILAFGVVALTFLMFCDHGPALPCFLRAALMVGTALAQLVILIRASTLLKQRQHLRLSAGLMILSIVPLPLAIVIFIRI
jgi:hypothetical protein